MIKYLSHTPRLVSLCLKTSRISRSAAPTSIFRRALTLLTAVSIGLSNLNAGYLAKFDQEKALTAIGPHGEAEWSYYSGDGEATVDFVKRDSFASMIVDARSDIFNTWWAVIRTQVDHDLTFPDPGTATRELRIEAKVRVSDAPRRINLQLFTTGTDHHDHLREFDIPTAGEWHTVSMTTSHFPLKSGEPIFAQIAMMDWGRKIFTTDVDYLSVAFVDPVTALPDLGQPQQYHPPLPAPETLPHSAVVIADSVIDGLYPTLALHDWAQPNRGASDPLLLAVVPSQIALLKWDLAAWSDHRADGIAVLELTTHSVTSLLQEHEELGRIRVVEILPAAPDWAEAEVSHHTFTRGASLADVTNTQPIIDFLVDPTPGARNRITLPESVMQRLLDGQTKGLALLALGPVHATFVARENAQIDQAPALNFRTPKPNP